MGETYIINLGRDSVSLIFTIVSPILLTALFLGIAIAILQAVTQIQDMSITFVPKFVAMFVVMYVLGGWMLNNISTFTIRLLTSIAYFTH
ncbi:MAG: hypothetical protein A2Y40_05580 [Candidatus Margulisbacteria bacterium GWF2_35_9]|nr:MAG: hypothetical protein A2Y40_05580 [Candidatus Margulisbacteria bacterium GWF2_35_9]